MKYRILIIMLTLVHMCIQLEAKQIRPEALNGHKIGTYRISYEGNTYFWDYRSNDMNRMYQYGGMLDSEYVQLKLDMIKYHSLYEYKTREYAIHAINWSAAKVAKDRGWEGEIERDEIFSGMVSPLIRTTSWKEYYEKKCFGKKAPAVVRKNRDKGVELQGWDYHWVKQFGTYMVEPFGFYFDDNRDYWFMPEIDINGDNYSIGTDFSIAFAERLPKNFRVWYDIKHNDKLYNLGMIENDTVKVYNPEAVFIYVYDFDEFRKASSDWVLHDRMAYGMEDDYSDDLKSPFEEAYGVKGQESMSRFTYGPIIDDSNSDAIITSRVFIHLRTELAKDRLVDNIHPAPEMNFKIFDYEYKSDKIDYKENVIYPGLNEYDNTDMYTNQQSIDLFMKRVDGMNIYDYWAGIYKSSRFILEEMSNYQEAMKKYIKSGSKTELKKAQKAVRRYNMMEAFREVYESKAMESASPVTKEADFNKYYSNDRLSISIWSGSTGAGSRKHRFDPGLKTAIPYFEGKDKPGNMGFIDGTKQETVWRVLNMNGTIDIMLKDWGFTFDHKSVYDFRCLGQHQHTGSYLWIIGYIEGGSKKQELRWRPYEIPNPFGKEWTGWYSKSGPIRDSLMAKFLKVPDKRWKFVTKNPGVVTETVPRGVITNTGGLLFGGYINNPADINYLKTKYGSMKGAWNSAMKGPYMIVSSKTYEKLGHSYFEKKAGRRLFKAEVTGAMIDASARTIVTVKEDNKVFKQLMKDPYFRINGGSSEFPTIHYESFKGSYTKVVAKDKRWLNETPLLSEIRSAIVKDEKDYPGCSILRANYIVNPDHTKGLLFLQEQFLETTEKDRLKSYSHGWSPYEDNIKGLQLGTIFKEFPSFLGNPNLFLAYYKNIDKIKEMLKKEVFTDKYGRYNDQSDFTKGDFASHWNVHSLYDSEYHSIYGDVKVPEYTSDPENSKVESIMSRYLSKSYEKAYLETKLDRKTSFKSHNNAQYIAYMSQARVDKLDEKTKHAFNFVYRNPLSGFDVKRNDDTYLGDLTLSIGQVVPRMTNPEEENLFLQDLGWQRMEYAELGIANKLQQFFPGMINKRDITQIYEYSNFSAQKAYDYKYKVSMISPTLVKIIYASDYEPGLISETYLRMNAK